MNKIILVLGIMLMLTGCTEFSLNSLGRPTPNLPKNFFEIRSFCKNAVLNRTACSIDEDCVCSELGPFMGNRHYYEFCVDKNRRMDYLVDWCGGPGKKPPACINNQCTNQYPLKEKTTSNSANRK